MVKLDKGRMQQGSVSITLDASGDYTSSSAITFPQSFEVIPEIDVVAPYGATQAKYTAGTITTSSFYIDVDTESVSTYQSATFPVQWVAVEPH